MALHQSKYAKGTLPIAAAGCAGVVVAQTFEFLVPTTIAEGDIIELAPLLAGCRLVDWHLQSEDLDSDGSPAIVWDIGLMSGEWGVNDDTRTCADELFDGTTLSQAGGFARAASQDAIDGMAITPVEYARSIGAKLVTDADVAVEGTIRLTLFQVA